MAPKSLWDPLSSGNLPKIRDLIPSPWSTTLHAKQLLGHGFYSIGYGVGRYGHTALSSHWASCVCMSLAIARLPAYSIGQRIEPSATHALAAWPAHCTLPRTKRRRRGLVGQRSCDTWTSSSIWCGNFVDVSVSQSSTLSIFVYKCDRLRHVRWSSEHRPHCTMAGGTRNSDSYSSLASIETMVVRSVIGTAITTG